MTPIPPGHAHHFAIADLPGPADLLADSELLAQFTGAASDGCATCQARLLTRLIGDSLTLARLIELACAITGLALGGLPSSLTSPSAPGLASPEFRQLARAGRGAANNRMLAECQRMTTDQRRRAAETATDLLLGFLGFEAAAPARASR